MADSIMEAQPLIQLPSGELVRPDHVVRLTLSHGGVVLHYANGEQSAEPNVTPEEILDLLLGPNMCGKLALIRATVMNVCMNVSEGGDQVQEAEWACDDIERILKGGK